MLKERQFFTGLLCDLLIVSKAYRLFRRIYGGMGSILMFHRVVPETGRQRLFDNRSSEVTPRFLESAVRHYLKAGYAVVSLDDVYEMMAGKQPVRRFVCFTFDDGYRDNFTWAWPIFRKYDLPFAIYVPLCFPDRSCGAWWYFLEEILLTSDHVAFELDGRHFAFGCSQYREKEEAFGKIRGLITDCGPERCSERLGQIFAPYQADWHRRIGETAMSWDQLRQLGRDSRVTIGAHTVNHPALNRLSPGAVRKEVVRSKERLESRIGRPVEHFAYPFGTRAEVGEREFEIVRSCGFKTATTTRSGNIFMAHRHHRECLPRIAFSEKRQGRGYLELLTSGAIPALKNRFQRVITL
ncbi:polysaccharide deacetylase [Desulfonema ishimotonii]|uniref:Polysaccharide deacetylase n=1 Tax=Desulfonema ishimotonii TaxID=45657 RepID=A0A401FVC4_9BACT|nr:polysaccharide deacetylase family protein [Desulfonema ishimotonii]GBC60922.1 polysaccharide deacetylase [Desulfonema ishimotonii]